MPLPRIAALAPLVLALAAGVALAQEVRLYGERDAVDPAEVARILGGAAQRPMKMRSLRLLDDPAAARAAAAPSAPEDAPPDARRPSALALRIEFGFDSAGIVAAARPQLDAIAAGIRMLPPQQRVVIEGHTDAAGPAAYNEALSLRRATAVKRYLVAVHGVDAARLQAVGLGESAPLPGVEPDAAENRRVQFRGG